MFKKLSILMLSMVLTIVLMGFDRVESSTSDFLQANVPPALSGPFKITDEERVVKEKWENLFANEAESADTPLLTYEYIPAENGSITSLLPKGAEPRYLEKDGDNIYIEYHLNNVRYTFAYYPDNYVVKTVKLLTSSGDTDENDVFLNYNNVEFDSYNIKKLQEGETVTRTEEEVKTIQEEMRNNPQNFTDPSDGTLIAPMNVGITSAKYVYWYAPGRMNAVRYYNQNWTFPALNDASRALKIYLTRDYYVEKRRTLGYVISEGAAAQAVADVFNTTVLTAKSLLNIAGVAVDIYDRLKEAAQPVPFQEYEYSWGNEGTVYDTTVHNQDVEVWQDWANGKMNLVNLINGQGKQWGVSAPAVNEPTGDLTETTLRNHAESLAQNVANIYNNNIKLYGSWKHGVGNGLGR
ncbi:hypothetical protein [Paenibacillus sp. J2TS4]|uniref:hypothetical protein n=1 Tax=Paenibacillus sp. J2TS4 TaxID=2807194 RepID=UPI001B214F04|nr:hypothetical protein [Paenibacillus sp. J2TS4]GIP32980.1 hypothetical protein J2TS4_21900 [Paenibacillus sp. J2TS4]